MIVNANQQTAKSFKIGRSWIQNSVCWASFSSYLIFAGVPPRLLNDWNCFFSPKPWQINRKIETLKDEVSVYNLHWFRGSSAPGSYQRLRCNLGSQNSLTSSPNPLLLWGKRKLLHPVYGTSYPPPHFQPTIQSRFILCCVPLWSLFTHLLTQWTIRQVASTPQRCSHSVCRAKQGNKAENFPALCFAN